ncbi:MAG: V-type ATP synthase subunit E family protein [Eubacteriaceae bacterium]|nr:V-type ATP synthase subunit E family protein [Eubacteriaceae bacterium]MDD4508513.1 V-type ATP synthase subunit E family protein [Eubacteriaceae bacterium]
MAKDVIINKIIEGAQADAESIINNAKKKSEQLKKDFLRETDQQLQKIQKNNEKKLEEIEKKTQLVERLEERKNTLSVKKTIIDEVFVNAEHTIDELTNSQWEQLITKIVLNAVVSGKEKLRIPVNDKTKYQTGFLDYLNNQLEKKEIPGQLTIDSIPANFKSGVMIIGEFSDINGDFKGILEDVRSIDEKNVSNILFENEE